MSCPSTRSDETAHQPGPDWDGQDLRMTPARGHGRATLPGSPREGHAISRRGDIDIARLIASSRPRSCSQPPNRVPLGHVSRSGPKDLFCDCSLSWICYQCVICLGASSARMSGSFGRKEMQPAALEGLEALGQEILLIGSYCIRKDRKDGGAGVLQGFDGE